MKRNIREYWRSFGRLSEEQMILVYTMGKVGSTSAENWLTSAFHTHTLYGDPPSRPYHIQKYGNVGFIVRRYTVYPLKRAMIRARKSVKIVTFYRDPRDRNPSMFMHDLPYWLSNYLLDFNVSSRAEDTALLVSAYKSIFPHNYPSHWVRAELSRFTGISTDDLSLGDNEHRVISRGKYSVFVGRAESMSSCLPRLANFLGIPHCDQITPSNRAAEKWYAPLYNDFLQSLRADASIEYAEDFRRANGYDSTSQT